MFFNLCQAEKCREKKKMEILITVLGNADTFLEIQYKTTLIIKPTALCMAREANLYTPAPRSLQPHHCNLITSTSSSKLIFKIIFVQLNR